ncbi:MAG: hypothetical protein HYV63_27915 [Candidatus Schekmanbacteria bacterium]|nr:hypothetical protein [Candidatus Schekmanbacteria bacterium]
MKSRALNLTSRIVTLMTCWAALASAGSPASAYVRNTYWGCSSGVSWGSDETVYISPISFPSGDWYDAINEPLQRINSVGGTWLDFVAATDNDTVGLGNYANEIYLTSIDDSGNTLATTSWWALGCSLQEADIYFDSAESWRSGVPADYGSNYWTASGSYIRPTALHEMFHLAGFTHEDDNYSFQNYGNRPWANTYYAANMIDPLPNDRLGLRAVYPGSATEYDIAALNTMQDNDDISSTGAAYQKYFCKPAAGSGFSSDPFSSYCATSYTTSVCPGDLVYTRFMVANYSNASANVKANVYFSADANLSTSSDLKAGYTWSVTTGSGASSAFNAYFTVPSGVTAGAKYWPIVNATQTNGWSEESAQNNWIPLTGQLTIKSSCS